MAYTERNQVLILVLVEHTLGEPRRTYALGFTTCLNPCFSGTYSRRLCQAGISDANSVLILVLVEHTLGVVHYTFMAIIYGLNPCFSGTYSRSLAAVSTAPAKGSLNPCFSGTYSRSFPISSIDDRIKMS